MPISLRTLCLVTAVLCNVQRSREHEIPKRSFLSRRAIDGSRGRKYFDPNEEGAFDSYGSAGGQYDPYDHVTDLSDIRKNVPGEPGVDYPAYSTLPQTGFTCEGRSRGYYADEAAGCQVFHVCHDVLVSSFLCPIGSTFSQKLLTCDWWTKVDCSATDRYLEVNRNNYQIDDDEMIRNAYAMISLQSSAEDVTKDGLVDPDSGARIIDYSTLGGRAAGYTPGFRRITDYPAVDATGNDLPSGPEDYPQRDDRQVLDYNRYSQEKIARTSSAYQGKFYPEDKERSPYHASPIIRHDYQGRATADNEFQNDYRRPDGFTGRLRASYAPTVPTVTSTTRRLYSPTVPTTYRPSTLAYSKLDLLMDSSDHLYAHSKGLMTPPTIARQNDDLKNADSRARETHHGEPRQSDGDDRQADAEARLDPEERSKPSFRINVTDTIDEDEVFRQQNDRRVVGNYEDESAEDIETKDSIGIARALNNPRGAIAVRHQDPVIRVLKDERAGQTTLPPLRTSASRSPGSHNDTDPMSPMQILKQTDAINETDSTEDHEDAANSTERSLEQTAYTSSSGDRTTPLVGTPPPKDDDDDDDDDDSASRESTVSITAKPTANMTGSFAERTRGELADRSSFNQSRWTADQNSASTKSLPSLDDGSTRSLGFGVPRPALFLRPPLEGFFINVPEETPYTTIDDSFKVSWSPGVTTTEIPLFSSAATGSSQDEPPAYSENIDEQALIDYVDEGLATTPRLEEVQPADRGIVETSTAIPWLVPSWHDRSLADVPVTDIVPPIVDYNDGFGDFIPPDSELNERSHTLAEFSRTESPRVDRTPTIPTGNHSEAEVLNQYNTEFQFTIRDAIKARAESEVDHWKPPCHPSTSDERTSLCETSSVAPRVTVSTSSVGKKAISIGTKATTSTPEQLISSGNTRPSEKLVTPVPDQSSTSISRSSVIIDSHVDVEDSTLKTVTQRDKLQTKELEDKVEEAIEATTTSSVLHSIRPGSFRQIEEAIDRQISPYEVSLTVNKDGDLDTTADDFISRLIAQHQQSTAVLKDQLGDFEIVRSVEPEEEVTVISQTPRLPDTSHTSLNNGNNGSFPVPSNDTADQFKESNVSMLSLLQLMAELLKLDRLPRPFSTKDLRNAELEDPTQVDLNESPSVTAYPLLDHSQAKTPFGNAISKASLFDILNIPADIAELKTTPNVGRNKQPPVTTSPLLDHSQIRTSHRNANLKTSAFDTLATKADNSKSRTPPNLDVNEPSSFTENPLLDQSVQVRTPFRDVDFKTPSFGDTLRPTSNAAFTLSPDVSTGVSPDHAVDEKTRRLKANSRVNRPFQKQEILEQLTENFGQPLYHGDTVHRSLVFDLPQVQRNLDFETGLLIGESKRVIDEDEESPESATARTTTTTTTTTTTSTTTQRTITTAESERTIVETEFVPSIGFSFDTDEGREEYVEAVLGGLIDDHAGGRNESSVAQLTHEAPKNETLRHERRENSEDV